MYSNAFLMFQINNQWLMWVCFSLMIVSEIAILCCQVGRTPPVNMVLLLIFTLCESYMVSFICSVTGKENGNGVVFMAAIMTLGNYVL